MAVFTPHSRVTGLESDDATQESEPTPQALSDGILVVGISSKGEREPKTGTGKIQPSSDPQNSDRGRRARGLLAPARRRDGCGRPAAPLALRRQDAVGTDE